MTAEQAAEIVNKSKTHGCTPCFMNGEHLWWVYDNHDCDEILDSEQLIAFAKGLEAKK